MITQEQMDELADILKQIARNCNAYTRTDNILRDDFAFREQVRKLAHDIDRWCDELNQKGTQV